MPGCGLAGSHTKRRSPLPLSAWLCFLRPPPRAGTPRLRPRRSPLCHLRTVGTAAHPIVSRPARRSVTHRLFHYLYCSMVCFFFSFFPSCSRTGAREVRKTPGAPRRPPTRRVPPQPPPPPLPLSAARSLRVREPRVRPPRREGAALRGARGGGRGRRGGRARARAARRAGRGDNPCGAAWETPGLGLRQRARRLLLASPPTPPAPPSRVEGAGVGASSGVSARAAAILRQLQHTVRTHRGSGEGGQLLSTPSRQPRPEPLRTAFHPRSRRSAPGGGSARSGAGSGPGPAEAAEG